MSVFIPPNSPDVCRLSFVCSLASTASWTLFSQFISSRFLSCLSRKSWVLDCFKSASSSSSSRFWRSASWNIMFLTGFASRCLDSSRNYPYSYISTWKSFRIVNILFNRLQYQPLKLGGFPKVVLFFFNLTFRFGSVYWPDCPIWNVLGWVSCVFKSPPVYDALGWLRALKSPSHFKFSYSVILNSSEWF